MRVQPIRRRVEPGIIERLNAAGEHIAYEISWKDADGRARRRSVNGNLRDARDALAAARTRRALREPEPANPRTTVDAVIAQYEAAVLPTLRPNSASVHRAAHGRISRSLGPKRVTAINRADVRRFIADMAADSLKGNTIETYHAVLRGLFTFAREDLEVRVTFPRVDLPDPADDQREHRVLTDDELARVLAACAERSRLYFRTLAETGARESEVLGLAPRKVGDGTVTFERQLSRDGSLQPLKTRRSKRTIEITRGLSAELRLRGDQARVFPLLGHWTVRRDWSAAVRDAGLESPAGDPRSAPHARQPPDRARLGSRRGGQAARRPRRAGLEAYAHEFDARRRGAERRAALEALYGATMATRWRPTHRRRGPQTRAKS